MSDTSRNDHDHDHDFGHPEDHPGRLRGARHAAVQFSEPGSPAQDGARLGYSACGTIARVPLGYSRLGGFGASGGFRDWEVAGNGVEHALAELRRATANLAASGWPDGHRDEALLTRWRRPRRCAPGTHR